MNVRIGTVSVQFFFWEYMFRIFDIVSLPSVAVPYHNLSTPPHPSKLRLRDKRASACRNVGSKLGHRHPSNKAIPVQVHTKAIHKDRSEIKEKENSENISSAIK